MANYSSAQNSGANEEQKLNFPGEIVIRAHYRAEDDSAEMVYGYNCPSDVSRVDADLLLTTYNIYCYLEKSITMLSNQKDLELDEMSVHEIFRDEYGDITDDKLLSTYSF